MEGNHLGRKVRQPIRQKHLLDNQTPVGKVVIVFQLQPAQEVCQIGCTQQEKNRPGEKMFFSDLSRKKIYPTLPKENSVSNVTASGIIFKSPARNMMTPTPVKTVTGRNSLFIFNRYDRNCARPNKIRNNNINFSINPNKSIPPLSSYNGPLSV